MYFHADLGKLIQAVIFKGHAESSKCFVQPQLVFRLFGRIYGCA